MRRRNAIHFNSFQHVLLGLFHAPLPCTTMKSIKSSFTLLSLTLPLMANPVAPVVTKEVKTSDWLKPLLDVRMRYEYGDVENLDTSNALSMRVRAGMQTKSFHGFSALVDGEFTRAAIDDYSGGARGAEPFEPKKTVIGDPETTELNQAYLQYQGWDTTVKAGRQRIKYDNDAFIGNVGWRQNEQTYDAFSLSNQSVPGLSMSYAYLGQVNRIFGSDASAPITATGFNVDHYDSDTHLFNASYKGITNLTLGSYLYLMDFEEIPAYDNQTVGFSAKTNALGLVLYGELAYQDKAGFGSDSEAMYFHGTMNKNIGNQSLTIGLEHLAAGFKTPLATLHAFNGFADVAKNQRANGSHNGIMDAYLTHSIPICFGMKWINTAHMMGDDELTAGYGWEFDSVLSKKFNDNLLALAKLAVFKSNGDIISGTVAAPDVTRFSIELDYTF